jgi:hypothetical protein
MTAQACMMTWLAGNMPCITHAAAKRHPRITPVPACQTALPKRTAEHHGMFMAQVHKCAAASVGQMTDPKHERCTAHHSPSAAHLACDLSHTGANRGLATILVAQRSSCPTCQAQTMHNPPYASRVAALNTCMQDEYGHSVQPCPGAFNTIPDGHCARRTCPPFARPTSHINTCRKVQERQDADFKAVILSNSSPPWLICSGTMAQGDHVLS